MADRDPGTFWSVELYRRDLTPMPEILLATINAKWIHPSYALRLLRANLGDLEERSALLEFALRQPLEQKTAPIIAARPRILALSVYIWNHLQTVELLQALNRHWERDTDGGRPIIVLGGPEVSHLDGDSPILALADWVVRGEGETVFPTLCRLLLRGDPVLPERVARELRADGGVAGVQGRLIDTLPVDLSRIDPGYRLYTEEDLARKLTYVEASRGCPFGCEFCLSSLDRRVRTVPLDAFLRNMTLLLERGAGSFKFLDRTFNLDPDRARAIMGFFQERLRTPQYAHFEMVPSRFPAELRSLLERFAPGTLRLEVGIQTFDPETARRIHRPSNPPLELEVLDFLRRKTGALVHADLIAGLPGEGLAGFAAGFDLLWAARPTELQLGILKRLPGTPLARHDREWGMHYSPEPPYEVIETSALKAAELNRIKNFARFWELVVNRGHFDALVPRLIPDGAGAFARFMTISDRLLARFGKNWGIDRALLRAALAELADE